jgi:molecular chaperone GrpE
MSENENKQAADQAAEELKKAAQEADQAEQTSEEPAAETVAADELAAAQAKAAEHYDLYVRAVAELENTRRRCAEDVMKAQKFGVEKFAQNLLPVVDSLEKAIEITADTEGPMREGLLTTYRQMLHALEVSGMTCIDPKGEKFDPNTQQAIAMVPAGEGQLAGNVAEVFQRGWKIHERVLRPAMVSVVQG